MGDDVDPGAPPQASSPAAPVDAPGASADPVAASPMPGEPTMSLVAQPPDAIIASGGPADDSFVIHIREVAPPPPPADDAGD